METEFPATMPFVMSFSPQPILLHSPRLEVPSLSQVAARPADISFLLEAQVASCSGCHSHLSSSSIHRLIQLQSPRDMLYRLLRPAKWQPMTAFAEEGIFIFLAVEALGGWSSLACSTIAEFAHVRVLPRHLNSSSLLFQNFRSCSGDVMPQCGYLDADHRTTSSFSFPLFVFFCCFVLSSSYDYLICFFRFVSVADINRSITIL